VLTSGLCAWPLSATAQQALVVKALAEKTVTELPAATLVKVFVTYLAR
jgi:hypothetical protein